MVMGAPQLREVLQVPAVERSAHAKFVLLGRGREYFIVTNIFLDRHQDFSECQQTESPEMRQTSERVAKLIVLTQEFNTVPRKFDKNR